MHRKALSKGEYGQWCFAVFEMPATVTGIVQQARIVQEKAHCFKESTRLFSQQIDAFKELDLLLDSLESLLFLMEKGLSNRDRKALKDSINKTVVVLTESTQHFLKRIEETPSEGLPLWGQQLKRVLNDQDESNLVMQGSFGLLDQEDSLVSRIRSRITSDVIDKNGFPHRFNQRAHPKEGFASVILALTEERFFEESRSYFNSLISNSLKGQHSHQYSNQNSNQNRRISLRDLRMIQRKPWASLSFTIQEAVEYIDNQFSTYDSRFNGRVKQAFLEGRICLISPSSNEPSFCFDTPKGSFIQVKFVGDLESLALLAHECGHLIHQEMVRSQFVLRQDIQAYLTEAIAMYFENCVIQSILNKAGVYLCWKEAQNNEWLLRHLLLVKFELALYQLDYVDSDSIANVWNELNREFYPSCISFPSAFANEGEKIAHLHHAPFYTLVYPAAYLFSQTMDEVSLKKLVFQVEI